MKIPRGTGLKRQSQTGISRGMGVKTQNPSMGEEIWIFSGTTQFTLVINSVDRTRFLWSKVCCVFF